MNKTTAGLISLVAVMLLTGCVVVPPLLEAAGRGDTAKVQQLLDQGTDVNARAAGNMTALISAAAEGRTETVELLLNQGADVNATSDIVGWTALLAAAQQGHTGCVRVLLAHGANINQRTSPISTLASHNALEFAREGGHTEMVQLIQAASRKGAATTVDAAPPPLLPKNNTDISPF